VDVPRGLRRWIWMPRHRFPGSPLLPEMEAMMEALLKEEEEVWLHKCGHSYCDGGAILRDLDRWSATISYVGCCQRRAMLQLVVMLAASQQRWCYLPTTTPRWGEGVCQRLRRILSMTMKDACGDSWGCCQRLGRVLLCADGDATMGQSQCCFCSIVFYCLLHYCF
jgi:hypothetical protein